MCSSLVEGTNQLTYIWNVDDDDDAKNTFCVYLHLLCVFTSLISKPQHLEYIISNTHHTDTFKGDESWRWLESKFEFPLSDWVRTQGCNSFFPSLSKRYSQFQIWNNLVSFCCQLNIIEDICYTWKYVLSYYDCWSMDCLSLGKT